MLPKEITLGCRIGDTRLYRVHAVSIGWMHLCKYAEYIIKNNPQYIDYSTPLFVDKDKDLHDDVVEYIRRRELGPILSSKFVKIAYLTNKILELRIIVNDKVYCVCGKPDMYYIACFDKAKQLVNIIVEVTLRKYVEHIIPRLRVYMIAAYMYTGLPTLGIIISNKGIYSEALSLHAAQDLIRFFKRRIDIEEIYVETPEWICSYCDLQPYCPKYGSR